jgi:hypothetical protein
MAGEPAGGVASWNGSTWSNLGGGTNGTVYAVKPFGNLLVAGGVFDSAGTVQAHNIAAWTGSNWQPLGDGVDGRVTALEVHDNSLIAGGDFLNAGGLPVNHIAQWYAESWMPLGTGVDGPVNVLFEHDSSLYVGGDFQVAGEKSSPYFARWDKYEGLPTPVEDDLDNHSLPEGFALSQNYPNPFNPSTIIQYRVPRRSHVMIDIFNSLGQKVRVLVDQEKRVGTYETMWDGKDSYGNQVATGVYMYRFRAGDHVETRKMMMLK